MTEPRKSVTSEVMEGIALVTFNQPPRNTASSAMWDALTDVLQRHAADPAVRVIVLTGAGHIAFVSDPDAAKGEQQSIQDAAAARARQALVSVPQPVIARIRGDCLGAGMLLALHADLLVAAQDSAFAFPAARWGAAYPPECVAKLVGLVGPQHAKRLLFTGGRVEAQEALRIGLVTLVVQDADLSPTVVDLARLIADNAPLAVAAAKRMVDDPAPSNQDLVRQCLDSQDYAAGIDAVRSHRQPSYQGR